MDLINFLLSLGFCLLNESSWGFCNNASLLGKEFKSIRFEDFIVLFEHFFHLGNVFEVNFLLLFTEVVLDTGFSNSCEITTVFLFGVGVLLKNVEAIALFNEFLDIHFDWNLKAFLFLVDFIECLKGLGF